MATLVLPGQPIARGTDIASEAVSLRSWLGDDWAIIFSHPDDFVRCELEMDRWLAIARRTLTEHDVRPLALAKPGRPLDSGWVSQVTGDMSAVLLQEPSRIRRPAAVRFDWLDWGARRLQDEMSGLGRRFVMIIDTTLCPRRTFAYETPNGLPSPLELVGWVRTLRECHVTPAARESAQRALVA